MDLFLHGTSLTITHGYGSQVEAAINFVEAEGSKAIVESLDNARLAINGTAGTIIS